MTKVRLQRSRIGAFVRQNKACRMTQHVGMNLEAYLGPDAGALDQLGQARDGERRAPLRNENEGRLGLTFQCAQRSQFIPEQWMRSRCSTFGAANMKGRAFELHV